MSEAALLGQEEATATLAQALSGDRMPHAWLLAGPRGIGKATLAWRFARALLSESGEGQATGEPSSLPFERRTAMLMDAGAHPDFALLERLEKPAKAGGEVARARGISIEQVRGLSRLLNSASSMGGRRVVLIDAADDLEAPAANALLKSLEEPPTGVVFLLVSHNPGRLLPTIRSRCRLIRMKPLDEATMRTVLQRIAPSLPELEQAALIREASGSPGQAATMLGLDLAGLETALNVVAGGGEAGRREAARLAATLSPASARDRLEAFVALVPRLLAARARVAGPDELGMLLARWEDARKLGEGAITPLQLEPAALVLSLCGQIAAAGDMGDRPEAGR